MDCGPDVIVDVIVDVNIDDDVVANVDNVVVVHHVLDAIDVHDC